MTVKDLIKKLEQQDHEAEVTLMMQPHYPMEYRLGGVCSGADVLEEPSCEEEAAEWQKAVDTAAKKVYLTEGSHVGYGIRRVWEVT